MEHNYFPKGIVLFFTILCGIPGFGQVLSVNPQDSLVIREFHDQLQAEGWPALWDDTAPARRWNNIFWEPVANGKVTGVGLRVSGSFTTEIVPQAITLLKDLDKLEGLYMIRLGLKRLIPEIGELTQLKVLHLADNELSALLPEVNDLVNLELLSLDRNRFTSLPDLSWLTNLKTLSLTQNYDLAEVELDNLTSLETLRLDFCPITELPTTIGQLTGLRILNVNNCKLSTFPDAMANLVSLQELHMLRNEFTILPPVVGSLRSLRLLDIGFNKLTDLPAELGQLDNLVDIRLDHNLFTAIPPSILDLPALRGIDASYNQITGSVPPKLFERPATLIDLSGNYMSGEILLGPSRRVPQRLHISGNRFELKDLHALYPDLAGAGTDLEFNPQRLIGSNAIMIPEAGTDVVITVDNYTPLAGARVNWYRANTVNGKLSADFLGQGNSWPLPDFDPDTDGGVFFCKVTHPDLPGLELESEEIRVIGTNEAPLLLAEDLKFRKDNIPLFTFSGSDDYTNGKDLVWELSASPHFTFSELIFIGVERREIVLTDPDWSGSEDIELRVTDEQGNTTTETVTITVLDETNAPPGIAAVPPIYMNFEFSFPDPGSASCQETSYFSAVALLNPFISDDLDEVENLTVRIYPKDPDDLAANDLIVNIVEGGTRKSINASSTSCGNPFFSVDFILEVEDRDGARSSREVVIINDPNNAPPQVSPIPEQVIELGDTVFPPLDLAPYVSDDNLRLDQLEFFVVNRPDIVVEFDKRDGTVIVNAAPVNPDGAYTDTVRILVHESTNDRFHAEFDIVYRILENRVWVSGTVLDTDATPIAGVELMGFERPVSTDDRGYYSVQVPVGWTGTVVPQLTGYSFSPGNIMLTDVRNDMVGNDFIGILLVDRYDISGGIVDETGKPLPDVLLQGFTDSVSTDANGAFATSETAGWTGTITPTLQGHSFSPESVDITDLRADKVSMDFTAMVDVITYAMSGTVTDAMGNPMPNVVMDGPGGTVTTDVDGTYTFTGTPGWSGTISPELEGYTFSPDSIMITDLQADLASVDFVAVADPTEFSISGTVMDIMGNPMPNVVMDGPGDTVTTDVDGTYTFTGGPGWSGTISPEREGYTFSPENIMITDLQADLASVDFVAVADPTGFSISGTVTDAMGNPMPNVVMDGPGGTVTTDVDGTYTFTGAPGWSGAISAELQGYTFVPEQITITDLSSDRTALDFTAVPVPTGFAISGSITNGEGNPMENVLLKGFTENVVSGMDGRFVATESRGWSGIIVPELEGHRFEPATMDIEDLDSDRILDFRAIPDTPEPVKMRVYPNPGSDGEFTIVLPQPEPIRSIRIFASSGRLVHEQRVDGTFGSYTVEHALPTGLYTLDIQTGEDRMVQKLLVR